MLPTSLTIDSMQYLYKLASVQVRICPPDSAVVNRVQQAYRQSAWHGQPGRDPVLAQYTMRKAYRKSILVGLCP